MNQDQLCDLLVYLFLNDYNSEFFTLNPGVQNMFLIPTGRSLFDYWETNSDILPHIDKKDLIIITYSGSNKDLNLPVELELYRTKLIFIPSETLHVELKKLMSQSVVSKFFYSLWRTFF